MGATAKEVLALASIEKCLSDTGADTTYNHCHNACCWLAVQIKKAGLLDYNIYLCAGLFDGKDHSWLMVEDEDSNYIVVDMTVDQFIECEVPYFGTLTRQYQLQQSVSLCDTENLMDLVNKLGE